MKFFHRSNENALRNIFALLSCNFTITLSTNQIQELHQYYLRIQLMLIAVVRVVSCAM